VFNEKYGRRVGCLTREAIHLLKQYQWPGNVRELRNLMERLFAETQGEVIGLRSLKEWYDERMNAARFARYDPRVTMLPYRNAIPLGSDAAPIEPPRPPAPPHPFTGENGDVVEVRKVPSMPSIPPASSRQPGGKIDLDPEVIRQAFADARGNITRAAAILGVHKATLYRHLKTLNMSRTDLEG
ncbi:hypothetical protein KBA41_03020, partial [Candidatus Ozemobacteraceae bacterium]|nr:hypothetical protein [Candidatus Ozemobacteraceae bacterium]